MDEVRSEWLCYIAARSNGPTLNFEFRCTALCLSGSEPLLNAGKLFLYEIFRKIHLSFSLKSSVTFQKGKRKKMVGS